MTFLRRIVFAAACAGLLTGLLVTVVHQVGTVPVIRSAEIFEKAAEAARVTPAAAGHVHNEPDWEPRDGFERTGYTALADVVTSVAYGLLLAAAFSLVGKDVSVRAGLWWGIAGFAVFTLAPGLGLPPEVPGTEAAPLVERQLWWAATALSTAGGLALLAFAHRWLWIIGGIALVVLPHVWGAPQVTETGSAAPAGLAHQFVVAVTIASFVSWSLLGTSTAYFFQRFKAG